MRNGDQRKADEALDVAIREIVATDDAVTDDHVLIDWIVVYACVEPSSDDTTHYGLAFPHGSSQAHRAFGLLSVGKRVLQEQTDE